MTIGHYLRIWFTSARYSIMRTLMFRGDFFVWALVELFWMTVNVLMVSVIYDHTKAVAGPERGAIRPWELKRISRQKAPAKANAR